MNITCHNCKARFNIPDNKIPADRDAAFKCPRCREKIIVPAAGRTNPGHGPQSHQDFSELFNGTHHNALVCIGNPGLKAKIHAGIRQMGFNTETAEDTRAAFIKMEYNIYHLVTIDDEFDSNSGISEIISRMNDIDMSLRRRICVVWFSRKFTTGDDMAALHASVNSIINVKDIARFESCLSRALTDHRNLYTVYNTSLKQAGRA